MGTCVVFGSRTVTVVFTTVQEGIVLLLCVGMLAIERFSAVVAHASACVEKWEIEIIGEVA